VGTFIPEKKKKAGPRKLTLERKKKGKGLFNDIESWRKKGREGGGNSYWMGGRSPTPNFHQEREEKGTNVTALHPIETRERKKGALHPPKEKGTAVPDAKGRPETAEKEKKKADGACPVAKKKGKEGGSRQQKEKRNLLARTGGKEGKTSAEKRGKGSRMSPYKRRRKKKKKTAVFRGFAWEGGKRGVLWSAGGKERGGVWSPWGGLVVRWYQTLKKEGGGGDPCAGDETGKSR